MYTSVTHSAATCGTKAMHGFFENWHLQDALFCFNRLMTAACADKLLLNTVPGNHLFFVNELKRLAEGASLALMEELGRRCIEEYLQISNVKGFHPANGGAKRGAGKTVRKPMAKNPDHKKDKQNSLVEEMEKIMATGNPTGFDQPDQWMNAPLGGSEWQNFPRHLTARQFEDPWLAVEAFVDYASASQREDDLDILLEQALGRSSVDMFITSARLIQVQNAWWQLLEGSHLLVIRGV